MDLQRTFTLLLLVASAGVPAGAAEQRRDALAIDHDHIAYVRPYGDALRRARTERRILIVRPFPIGGVRDGSRDGRWCPLADYMRAVTLSDETVTTLVNRRFVFTYFSLVDWADLSDTDAKAAIVRLAPEYGAKVRRTPPTFFLSPTGELLATLDTMASPDAFLALATRLLAEHPEYAEPSREEAALRRRAPHDARARLKLARLDLELGDAAAATSALEALARPHVDDAVRAEALLLLARRARAAGDVSGVEDRLATLTTLPAVARADLGLELALERAHLAGLHGDWQASLSAWGDIEAARPAPERMGEVLYWKGLAYAHLGQWREANHSWVRVLTELPEGR